MERIATYILGPLPETGNGNRYILVIADFFIFTKWKRTEAFSIIPHYTAETVAKCLVNEVHIHSDQGRSFESQLYQEVCAMLNIKKPRTTPYHPQSDRIVEMFN